MRKQKITPFLWFDGQAEQAMHYYVSIFKNSKAGKVTYYNEDSSYGKKGQVMSVRFELDGQEFYGLNGGPMYKFSPAISFFVHCDTQAEIDDLWEKLSAGGEENNFVGRRRYSAAGRRVGRNPEHRSAEKN